MESISRGGDIAAQKEEEEDGEDGVVVEPPAAAAAVFKGTRRLLAEKMVMKIH